MKLHKVFILLCFLFLCEILFSQTLIGIVLDAKTKAPIETATVYFDNTTKGVITNKRGEFSISYSEAIRSPLVISFLGYEKQTITDYRKRSHITIFLKESHEPLDEVVIDANDGMTRKQKLKYFKREFLGTSAFGNSCRILNEDDIILRYIRKKRVLAAYSKAPLQIENHALQYVVSYDLSDFNLIFQTNRETNIAFNTKSVGFLGTTFYRDMEIFNKKKALRNRKKAYTGSRLQFMRLLHHGSLKEHKFEIYLKNTKVNPWEYLKVFPEEGHGIKQVTLERPMNILYRNWEWSSIKFLIPSISIDFYGNYTNADKVLFSGAMGEQRVGEQLPFDYGLEIESE